MPLGTKFLPCPSIGTPGKKRKYKTFSVLIFYPKILNPTRQLGPGADTKPTSVGERRRASVRYALDRSKVSQVFNIKKYKTKSQTFLAPHPPYQHIHHQHHIPLYHYQALPHHILLYLSAITSLRHSCSVLC